ncbi:MAG TPA: protein kinase [Candidatus Sulfotelmatobacter sp.]|jgi:Tol biopolymer transport system component
MALTAGTKFGPYEIQSPLGAGGMGEVYLARDTRLDRTVAIKILPSQLSGNSEARSRFEREARTISSLNHPNICTLHDVGVQDNTSYLVMEYVEGETLQSRLQKGPLPLKQALECCMQICDALEKAHRAGIVHRDLKPGNIMLTPSGAKLLDFGLAKPVAVLGAKSSGEAGLTPSTPTMNLSMLTAQPAQLTQHGMIVGTFQYMAPEVLQGEEATARSDIFSLGCVLYEMVTGRRAFEGKTQLSVMTAILEKDPEPLSAVHPTSPLALEYVIQTCLEKNPEGRFQTAHDLRLQLLWIAKSGSQTGVPAVAARKSRRTVWIAALAILAAAAIALAAGLWSARAPRRVLRSNILPPEGTIFETLYRNAGPALSPDGTHIAFIAKKDGKNLLWLRSLDRLEATPVRGSEDSYFPFWSPDGAEVAFFMQGQLWRTDLNGGSPTLICNAPEARGGSWGHGDVIIFAPSFGGPIFQVPAAGGTAKPVTSVPLSSTSLSDRWPAFLPDGKHFLFLRSQYGNAAETNEVHMGSLDGSDAVIFRGRFYTVQYAAGRLLAVRDGSLLAWKFDAASGRISGDPVPVVDKVSADEITALSVFSVSTEGTLLYQVGTGTNGDRHIWMDRTGKELSQASEPFVYGPTRISPDGARIATSVMSQAGNSPLWIWDLAGGTRSLASATNDYVNAPVWSSDGRTIYFDVFNPYTRDEIQAASADGSQPEHTLIKSDRDLTPTDVTSDGKWLLYEEAAGDKNPEAGSASPLGDAELKAFPLTPGGQPFTVLSSVGNGSNARLRPVSNDWVAYQSNQSGRSQVYLTRFPHPGAKYQVSKDGATQPVWSTDGKTLYFLDAFRQMTAVEIELAGESVRIGAAKTLFQSGIRHSISIEAYDVSRDGRFLVVDSITESKAPVVLVTNWNAQLKK